MRIEPGNSNVPPPSGRKPGRATSRPSSSSSASSTERPSESVVSAELSPFANGLTELPEVRMDVVEEVRERLRRGEHLTRDAAERTAAAILADLASFIGQ